MASLLCLSTLGLAAASAQPAKWVQMPATPLQIQPRVDHIMAYDAARDFVVTFGGFAILEGRSIPYRDSWEWNGADWIARALNGPAPYYGNALVYDSARDVSLFFGGSLGGGQTSETWDWDGTVWTRRLVSDPPPRHAHAHAMTYDSARGVTVLFGGLPLMAGTWEWNGTEWSLTGTDGPTPRAEHAFAVWGQQREHRR